MELGSVVQVLEMTQFVEHHEVLQFCREAHQLEVQVDVPFDGTAAPVRPVVAYDHAVVGETVLCGEFGQSPREVCLSLCAEFFDGRAGWLRPGAPAVYYSENH